MIKKKRSGLLGVVAFALATVCLLSACSGTDTPGSSSIPVEPTPSSQESSTPSSETPEIPGDEASSTDITMTFDDTVITAALDDSETTKAFLAMLPLSLDMNRYADREYYAPIGELPETGEAIDDFENGDVTYYTTGKSLAIFFGNADSSSQGDLIRMGKITSDLSLFDSIGDSASVTIAVSESEDSMADYDFDAFTNVKITGIDLSDLSEDELSVLYRQARYCQAMTEADTDTMAELVAEDVMFTHMSGKQQTRAEYFADIEDGSLRYFTIGIENPVIEVNGKYASIAYTSVLNANAYGARGTYRMEGTHRFENIDGQWVSTNEARKNSNG